MSSIIYTLLSGALGALIGTFGGVYLTSLQQEQSRKKNRKIALKALGIINKYSKKDGTFDQVEQEFNNSMSIAEKRAVLVALHKLGIPIIVKPDSLFTLDNVCFDKVKIDKEELADIEKQFQKGLCDHLFFMDPETYFNENIRIVALRSLAKGWVVDVLSESNYNREDDIVHYPKDWFIHYSWGEKLALGVFKARASSKEYFGEDGKSVKPKIDQLLLEIDRGLWDNCLSWDFEAYQGVQITNSLNSQLSSILQANNEKNTI